MNIAAYYCNSFMRTAMSHIFFLLLMCVWEIASSNRTLVRREFLVMLRLWSDHYNWCGERNNTTVTMYNQRKKASGNEHSVKRCDEAKTFRLDSTRLSHPEINFS